MQHADWERELRRRRKNGVKENVPISRRINNREEGEDKDLERMNPKQLFSRKEIEGGKLGANQETTQEQPIRCEDGTVGAGTRGYRPVRYRQYPGLTSRGSSEHI